MTLPSTQRPRSPRMELLLSAALRVAAERGLRGLTHRAVDRAAGLPEGSCSAYLRTRKALVLALTEDVEGLAVDLTSCELGDDQAIENVTSFFMRWLDEPELLLTRMELSLESARDPELASLLAAFRRRLVELVESILSARGKDQGAAVAETLVASFDGVLLSASGRPAAQRRPFVRQSMEVLMGGLG